MIPLDQYCLLLLGMPGIELATFCTLSTGLPLSYCTALPQMANALGNKMHEYQARTSSQKWQISKPRPKSPYLGHADVNRIIFLCSINHILHFQA